MKEESPYERIMREAKEKEEARLVREREAKQNLRYGMVKVSVYRYRILEYEGVGFDGEAIPLHHFRFVSDPLSHSEAISELVRLEKRRREEHGPST